jgi:adenylate kinase family enzyme
MTLPEAYEYTRINAPKVIHLSGKTSTGKSTFANKLAEDYNYAVIKLDHVVKESVMPHYSLKDEGETFIEVYKNRNNIAWIDQFLTATENEARTYMDSGRSIILDGAISNPITLASLLNRLPKGVIFFFHPAKTENYIRNLTNRFKESSATNNAGLPLGFWKMVDKNAYQGYLDNSVISPKLANAIRTYATKSQQGSSVRLHILQQNFDNVLVVEI